MAVKLSVASKVLVKSRISILHDTLNELVVAFKAMDEAQRSTLKKGVLEKKIIRSIYISYLDSKKEVVCKITLKIDWELHKVFSDSSDQSSFEIDPSKSLNDQLAEWSKHMIEHVNRIYKHFDVDTVNVSYEYIPEIKNDSEKYKSAQLYLGHVLSDSKKWSEKKGFDFTSTYKYKDLKELSITIDHNK